MEDIDVHVRERSATRNHERLKTVYGDATMDVSTVRQWVCCCKQVERETSLPNKKRNRKPLTAVTPSNIQQVGYIICGDR
ncbi:hypothetical protein Trydic_g2498 [Trypoxylus dichotomus]